MKSAAFIMIPFSEARIMEARMQTGRGSNTGPTQRRMMRRQRQEVREVS